MIKKLLLGLLILVLLVVGGAVFWLLSLDLNAYRQPLEQKIEEATGYPVEIGALDLGWGRGATLRVEDIKLLSADGSRRLAVVDLVEAQVMLRPLLRREVVVRSIVISRPDIDLAAAQTADEAAAGGMAVAAPAGAGSEEAGELPVDLVVKSVRIRDGRVRFPHMHAALKDPIELRQLDVELKDIRPGRPLDFSLRASLLGERQNLEGSGVLALPAGEKGGSVQNAAVSIEGVDLSRLLDPKGLGMEVQGMLSGQVRGSVADLNNAQATVNGTTAWVLDRAVIRDHNFPQMIFQKIVALPETVSPGFGQKIMERLPQDARDVFNARDTVLDKFAIDATVRGEAIDVELAAEHSLVRLQAAGPVRLDRPFELAGQTQFSPAITDVLLHSVRELDIFVKDGWFTYPLTLMSGPPFIRITPDHFVQRFVQDPSQLLRKVLDRALPRPEEEPAQTPAQTPAPSGEGSQTPAQQQAAPQEELSTEDAILRGVMEQLLGGSQRSAPAQTAPQQTAPQQSTPQQTAPQQPSQTSPQSSQPAQQQPAQQLSPEEALVGDLLRGLLGGEEPRQQ